jgi:hypothetical protein
MHTRRTSWDGIIGSVDVGAPNRRLRRRLSRSLSRARWREYRTFLESVARHGYRLVELEEWLAQPPEPLGTRTVVLRHDVDQHPASALRMAAIERELGVSATWYFRWRTAHPAVIEAIRESGDSIGLHYETLTRHALEHRLAAGPELDALIPTCREELRAEVAAFTRRFGPIRSICPHGDSRVPGVTNAALVAGEDWSTFGIAFDGNEAVKTRELGAWLSDRSSAEGGWGKGYEPERLFTEGVGPVLAVVHPNNWVSGPDLWKDRLLAAALPPWERMQRPIRTGRDQPQLGD